METTSKEMGVRASPASVYEISGEPAIVINGVPNVGSSESSSGSDTSSDDNESKKNVGFGEWLEGREVRKLFGEQFYSGTVRKYDRESGWYRVVYEDGDSEDLEWHELEEIILPLDTAIPLKSLALKVLKKSEKSTFRKSNIVSASGKNRGMGSRGKAKERLGETSSIEFNVKMSVSTNSSPGSANQ